jgi:hypothetical protein
LIQNRAISILGVSVTFMPIRHSRKFILGLFGLFFCFATSPLQAQGAKQSVPESAISETDADHVEQRNAWFFRGRIVPGKPGAELRRRAYASKLRMRAERAAAFASAPANTASSTSTASWIPLGPAPLASDATGNGTQDYGYVAGRATAVAIDPADATGNTVYIGGAQSGVWRSINAAAANPANVIWSPLTDDEPTLSIGAIAIQPGNNDPTKSVILAATGEANNSGDSYFGLGMLRSTDGGSTWTLIPTANAGTLSFSGLGGTRVAFSTASANTVVAAMATSSEGLIAGAIASNTDRGLYTSRDAGQSWTYDALLDSGITTDATSATSVVFNAVAGKFFAAVRYHGFYSSADGVTWTRLANQPGGAVLSASSCPPQSTSNAESCPIYRAELTVVPGRNEMYAWYVYFSSSGELVDGGIWQTLNGAATTWTQINDSGIANCGIESGCGVEQGSYNLELLAVPNKAADTDLYVGAINLYKCRINALNPTCGASPFINLTHVYGCDPIAAPAHVHPDQHAMAFTIPTSGNALMYFANDGGIYRALNGFTGFSTTGSCSDINQFDDLNQNLGSMTQFVSFSQHPSDPNTLLGGTQDNGSPASNQATTSAAWGNVLGGDGGYNAIDPSATSSFYASNPDLPPGGLGIQRCTDGVSCTDYTFSSIITSSTLGGDDGGFYFPYILDPQSTSALLVGTCRIWRGPRNGGSFTAISPNFDTFGSGTCTGNEVNQVRGIAAGGATDSNGSTVVYATTSGYGPLDGPLYTPTGGHVWVTVNASAGLPSFNDVTNNGPQGNINPNQFPISNVEIDSSDPSGQTAYLTVMGFTGGTGHVWKTTNAGNSWSDFTGNLPDSPANAVVIDPAAHVIYLGTDVGVFASPTSPSPNWAEVGAVGGGAQTGSLPNVAVTALGLFNSGGSELLRASTYGRGMWQCNLHATPDYQLAISNSPQSVVVGQNAIFNGSETAQNGYSYSVTMECVAGTTPPPSTCTISPSAIAPSSSTSFTVTAGGAANDYYFNVQGVGADPNQTTHQAAVVLHVLSSKPDFTLSDPLGFPTVNAGSRSTSGTISVNAQSGFTGTISLSCSLVSGNGTCSINPATVASIPATPSVIVNAALLTAGSYQLQIQGTSGSTTHTLLVAFNVGNYQLTGQTSLTIGAATQSTDNLTIQASQYYGGNINATCDASSLTGATASTCSLTPGSPIVVSLGAPVSVKATINVPNTTPPGTYNIGINTQDTTGEPSHNFTVSITVPMGDFETAVSQPFPSDLAAGSLATAEVVVTPTYAGSIKAHCDPSAIPGAQCSVTPSNPVAITANSVLTLSVSVNVPKSTAPGAYSVSLAVTDSSGQPSHSIQLPLTVVEDFSVISATPSQTVKAGQMTGPYQLTIAPNPSGASFNESVTLTCSGLPAGAHCLFNPASVVMPGSSGAAVVMNISTASASALHSSAVPVRWLCALLLLPGIISIGRLGRRSQNRRVLPQLTATTFVLALAFSLLSCGGASSSGTGGGSCGAAPSVPGGLAASGVSSSGAMLTWTASTGTAGCSVTGYSIYENGTQIETSTSTTYAVSGLAPSTQYSFAVAASDVAGNSAPSAAITVTTLSNGGTTYPITITGTSGSISHSITVNLVVQ